jgi:alkylation response protein AidB-like acyl-CoA dehydrogenase
MDMRESKELAQFRAQVREWTLANLPKEKMDPYHYVGMGDRPGTNEWFERLAKQQWLAFRWPKKFGGPDFTQAEQIVFVDELQNCGAPVPGGFGLTMVGPLILQFGTEQQKQRFLPPIAHHQEIWCQGYSEPNAGSDLASLQTRAVQEDGHFMVNGQKTWTSRANVAGWIFVLVRTNPAAASKQKGISFMLVDMKSPGVTIRPIKQIDGQAEFYETFFDNVKVPAENLVGKVNEGWTMAKHLLGHERAGTGAAADIGLVRKLKSMAGRYERDGAPLLKEREFRHRLAQMEMDSDCLRYTRYRMLSALMQGKAPGPESSIFKLYQSELVQRLCDLGMEAMGPESTNWYDRSLPPDAYDIPMYTNIHRAMSIYSGSNEVQRNIIAKRVLDLPD